MRRGVCQILTYLRAGSCGASTLSRFWLIDYGKAALGAKLQPNQGPSSPEKWSCKSIIPAFSHQPRELGRAVLWGQHVGSFATPSSQGFKLGCPFFACTPRGPAKRLAAASVLVPFSRSSVKVPHESGSLETRAPRLSGYCGGSEAVFSIPDLPSHGYRRTEAFSSASNQPENDKCITRGRFSGVWVDGQ